MVPDKIKILLLKALTLALNPERILPMNSSQRTSSKETWGTPVSHRTQVGLPMEGLNMALLARLPMQALSLNMTLSMAPPDRLHRKARISLKDPIDAPTILLTVRHLRHSMLVPILRSVVAKRWWFPAVLSSVFA